MENVMDEGCGRNSSKLRGQIVLDWVIVFDGHCIAFGHLEFNESLDRVVLETVSKCQGRQRG